MKNGLFIWNVVLTLASGYLLVSHFSGKKITGTVGKDNGKATSSSSNSFRIAYFEMDSLAANFDMVKDLKAEMIKREEAINAEMDRLSKNLQQKFNSYQQQATSGSMTEEQSEAASRDMKNLDDQMKSRKQALDSDYSDFVMRRQNEIKSKIETFLKEYNRTKDYSYIVSYEQGLFYYKDTAYNITADVVKGLNELYKTKKN
ncbi:MAG: OmpH family outer membrane protein [Chitinophagaceae bacterium]|nr:OmpH family outer membrane protein [Chitinophagaceae bacterium]HQV86636.1 OmpH family outer membrane protein [Chitinophagaceae bacterium]HQX73405.1 OmpH family outer membrane protein [Chitinophagaceae bacterium]